MNRIVITMPAVRRPEIIRQTLTSFRKNLFREYMKHMKILVNIDPVGLDMKSEDVLPVFYELFKKENIKVSMPGEQSFPRAICWLWKEALRTDADYIFQMEDDWELVLPVNLEHIIHILDKTPKLAHLRLSMFKGGETVSMWHHHWPWNGLFYECPIEMSGKVGWCGHPSFNRASFIRAIINHLDPNHNVEKQIKKRHPLIFPIILKHKFGCCQVPGNPPQIKDLGRAWLRNQPWEKGSGLNVEFFTKWLPAGQGFKKQHYNRSK